MSDSADMKAARKIAATYDHHTIIAALRLKLGAYAVSVTFNGEPVATTSAGDGDGGDVPPDPPGGGG